MGKLIFIILVLVSQVSLAAISRPQWEVRTAPIAFIARWLTLDLSYIANENWAFGPSYIRYANESEYGNMLAPTYNGNAVGAHVLWAENFTDDAIYLGGHYYVEDYRSRPEGFLGYDDYTGSKLSAVIGKRSFFAKSFSVMGGIGYEFYNHEKTSVRSSGTSTVAQVNSGFLHFEFKMGYFF